MTHQEVCDKIATLQTQAEEIVTRNAAVEHWSSEDQTKFDKIHADMKGYREQKRRLDLQLEVKTELESATRKTDPDEIRHHEQKNGSVPQKRASEEECDGALRAWMLSRLGIGANIKPEWRSAANKLGVNLNADQFPFQMAPVAPWSVRQDHWERWEKRALTVTTTAGGYLISASMNQALEEARLFYGPMLQLATVIRTETGANLPFPTFNGTATVGRILGINTQATLTDPSFGQMVLGAFKYSSDGVLVPEELLQDSGVPMSDFLPRARRAHRADPEHALHDGRWHDTAIWRDCSGDGRQPRHRHVSRLRLEHRRHRGPEPAEDSPRRRHRLPQRRRQGRLDDARRHPADARRIRRQHRPPAVGALAGRG